MEDEIDNYTFFMPDITVEISDKHDIVITQSHIEENGITGVIVSVDQVDILIKWLKSCEKHLRKVVGDD